MRRYQKIMKSVGTFGVGLALTFSIGCGGGGSSPALEGAGALPAVITSETAPKEGMPPSSGDAANGPAEGAPGVSEPPAPPAFLIFPVQAPLFKQTLNGNGGDEGWMSSPAVADLDGDGAPEIIAARTRTVYAWHADGALFWKAAPPISHGRIFGPPVVADLDRDGKLEVAVGSSAETVSVWNWDGTVKPGWPRVVGGESGTADREVRSLAAGTVGADGKLGLLAARTRSTKVTPAYLFDHGGNLAPGWPQLSTAQGCILASVTANCFEAGAYNQNVGIADLNGDGLSDMIIGYDSAYAGVFHRNGAPFAADPATFTRPFFNGIPAFHNYALAKKGSGPDGSDRSEFMDSPPVVADLDGDGIRELILVGDHERAGNTTILGNALFIFHPDATRPAGFEAPFESGPPLVHDDLNPVVGNIIDVTGAPAVADLDGDGKKEVLFQSYDGHLYAVRFTTDPAQRLMWRFSFAETGARFASEPVIVDLNGDLRPEILFTTYETGSGKSALIVLDAEGKPLFRTFIPGRGAMAAPTVADIDGDDELELLVNLKDAVAAGIEVYDLPGSRKSNLIPWPTGRGNFLRNGDVPR